MSNFLHELREKSVARAINGFKTYKNVPDTYWTTALAGEIGELCNMIKKLERVKHGGVDGGSSYTAADIDKKMLAEEIGGILIYVDLLASLFEVDLKEAIITTFNEKSKKYGWDYFLTDPDANEAIDALENKVALCMRRLELSVTGGCTCDNCQANWTEYKREHNL